MASEELYEVERIVDKRKNKKGKMEYLVRWRGYGYEGDTWEPESHLSACMEFIHHFNQSHGEKQKDGTLLRSTQSSPSTAHSHGSSNNARKQICRPQPHSGNSGAGSHALVRPASSPTTAATAVSKRPQQQQLPPLDSSLADAKTDTQQLNLSQKYSDSTTCAVSSPSFTSGPVASPVGTARRSMDLAKSGIKILVPKSPMSSWVDSEESPSEAAHSLEHGGQEQDSVPPEVALLEKPLGVLLGPGEERARMGTRPRTQSQIPLIPQQVPITPASIRTLNGKGTSTLMEALAANGTANLQQSAVARVTAVSGVAGKRRFEEQRSVFDKRLRFSVRQTESAYRYRDLVVKKQDGFTHILLSTKTSENNSLNPDVMKEMQSAMATAAADDSKLVLLSAVGSFFCFGLDFIHFIRRLTDDRKKESIKMAETIRTFVNTFIQFKKPIVVAVNGSAVGLGASILPLCDVVWANEKAWFQTPYTTYGQTPDACASITFPRIMGVASVLRESKALVRNANRAALEQANERECEALKRVWGSSQGMDSILQYLQKKIDEF
ncbi:unnamed protein product [Coregonus sp. 'balchen']|nr:unnamed protein product [Coregonus sp. 'balchen']